MPTLTFPQLRQKILQERFVNLIGDDPRKQDYAEDLFRMLQTSYASIGGIHGSGFASPEDMVRKIPFWKIAVKNGVPVAVTFYKDKSGRKGVASATDGSPEGKKQLADIMRSDIKQGRSFKEVSSKALSFLKKQLPDGELAKMAVPVSRVKKILKDDEIYPVEDSDPEVRRHPDLKDFFYRRKIGGALHTKILVGTPGKHITPPV